jgi:hypothetical protein
MTAISAASVGVKTMADGTLRITFDIEPSEAGAAFALFGKPGTPAALAALVTGYAAKSDEPEKPKGGPLSKEAALLCQNAEFQHWLRYFVQGDVYDANAAAKCVRDLCRVQSRAEFDTDAAAGQRFIDKVRIPFMRDTRENWNGKRERATA